MRILINEKISEHKFKTPEGYLICTDAILARTGKQQYTRDEAFGDGSDEIIDIDRPYEEVFSDKTLASFENKPITIEHPEEDVNIDNYKDYAVGFIRDVHEGNVDGNPVMLGNLVITDKEAIEKIESGEMTELSCGYDCDIKDDNGQYHFNNIRGNHLALCKEGRAGIARIVDSKIKDSLSKIEGVPPELLLSASEWLEDKIYIERKYHVKIYNITSNKGLTVTGNRQDLEKLYKDYHLKDYYGLKVVDSKVKDDDESWFEMLLKSALKEHEKEFSSDISPMVANRVAKKHGVKIGYIRNSKEYRYKYTYIISDSKIKDSLSKKEKELCDYMLENALDDGEDENDLLKKMKVYYSEYSNLARSKSDEVLRYFKSRINDSKVEDDNLLGKKVRIRKRYSNLDGAIGTIYSYEGTNYDDEVEVKRNGHIYKVDYEDIEFLDSKVKDAIPDSLKEALRKLGKSFKDLKDDNIYNRVREYIENKYGEKEFDKVYDYLENYINKHGSYEDSYENDYSKEMTMSDALRMLNIVDAYKKVNHDSKQTTSKDASKDKWGYQKHWHNKESKT